MKPHYNVEKYNIPMYDEEEILSPNEDIGFKFVIMNHMNRISRCIGAITEPGKKATFYALVRLLHSFIQSKKYHSYIDAYNELIKKHDDIWKKKEDFWTKFKAKNNKYGIPRLDNEGQSIYGKEKEEWLYQKTLDMHDLIMQFFGDRGWTFEERRTAVIGNPT